MGKGDGLIFVLIGLVAEIASCFLDMFTGYNLGNDIVFVVKNINTYWNSITAIPSYFSPSIITGVESTAAVLAPILFVLGIIFVLIGMNTSDSSGTGAALLLIVPIVMLIEFFIMPLVNGTSFSAAFGAIQAGFYISIVGGLLIIIGASKNRVSD